jgi:type IV pilus assembly protein PilW
MSSLRQTTAVTRGFSLVELMVALVIGLIIMGAVLTLFVSSNKQYTTTDSMARLQENARFVVDYLTRDIRRVAFFGCQSNDPIRLNLTLNADSQFKSSATGSYISFVNDPRPDRTTADLIFPLRGIDKEACIASGAAGCPLSDTLTLVYIDAGKAVDLKNDMVYESDSIVLNTTNHGFNRYDIAAITDCQNVDIFQITNITMTGSTTTLEHDTSAPPVPYNKQGNAINTLNKPYSISIRPTRVMRIRVLQYYIKNGAGGRPALFRGDEELVDGVDAFQVTYGVATTATPNPTRKDLIPNQFVTADLVTDWNRVVSIRVGFLVSTIADTQTGQYSSDKDTTVYSVNGVNNAGPFNDRRSRKPFESVIQIRNVPGI